MSETLDVAIAPGWYAQTSRSHSHPAFASDLELRLAGAVGSARSRTARGPGAARIRDRHGDIGPGQTAPLRIDDFDLDHEGTLIRGRFRGSGARRALRDLSGRNRLASFLAWIACAGGFSWRIAEYPIPPAPAVTSPAIKSRSAP